MAELHALRAFVAVARRGTFTIAADDLGVSQQAVSRAVAGLEAELGVALLERHARGARPTAAGASLLADGERLLADLAVALDRARQAADGSRGLLRIATTPALSDAELTAMVDALRAEVPGAEVSIVQTRPGQIAGALARDEADVVLGRTLPHQDDIAIHPLGQTRARLALPSSHRLAARRRLKLADLAGERLVVWSTRSAFTDLLLGLFAAEGIEITPVPARVVGRIATAEVADGDAVAIVPVGMQAWPGVRYAALEPPIYLPLVAATRRWAARPLALRFIATARAALDSG
jgi:DNA-binding transcriptional LysR family regulator